MMMMDDDDDDDGDGDGDDDDFLIFRFFTSDLISWTRDCVF